MKGCRDSLLEQFLRTVFSNLLECSVSVFWSAQVAPERACAVFSSAQVAPQEAWSSLFERPVAPKQARSSLFERPVAPRQAWNSLFERPVAPEQARSSFFECSSSCFYVFLRENTSFHVKIRVFEAPRARRAAFSSAQVASEARKYAFLRVFT